MEWMLGFPDGWVTELVPDNLSRTQALRMLGNAVQVQVGTVVGAMLLTLLPDAPCDTVHLSPEEK